MRRCRIIRIAALPFAGRIFNVEFSGAIRGDSWMRKTEVTVINLYYSFHPCRYIKEGAGADIIYYVIIIHLFIDNDIILCILFLFYLISLPKG